MRPADAQAKIKECASRLDSATLHSKLKEYEKGGHRSASLSDGRGGEPPLPMLGKTDRQISVARDAYQQCLTNAALELEKADRIQQFWTVPLPDETVKAEKLKAEPLKGAGPCVNIWCDHVCTGHGNDRLREGRCRPHYRVWKLEGQDRDPRKELTS